MERARGIRYPEQARKGDAMAMKLRIGDDTPLVAVGLIAPLVAQRDFEVCGEAVALKEFVT
jgi:hypothetical protein